MRDAGLSRRTIRNEFLVDIPNSSIPHVAINVKNSTIKHCRILNVLSTPKKATATMSNQGKNQIQMSPLVTPHYEKRPQFFCETLDFECLANSITQQS